MVHTTAVYRIHVLSATTLTDVGAAIRYAEDLREVAVDPQVDIAALDTRLGGDQLDELSEREPGVARLERGRVEGLR